MFIVEFLPGITLCLVRKLFKNIYTVKTIFPLASPVPFF